MRQRRDVAARATIAARRCAQSRLIFVDDRSTQAIEVSNRYAPEHLIIQTADPRARWTAWKAPARCSSARGRPKSVGDYCSGSNHVLPTYGHARAWSGVSVASFQKQITVQELTPPACALIGPCAATLAVPNGCSPRTRGDAASGNDWGRGMSIVAIAPAGYPRTAAVFVGTHGGRAAAP